ncbi:MAG TPA: PQQ-dependent sugar dehydrogenase [Longimicrobiales bacterium]|nr:PQQ-dependent sugar dehydrogenase [Longimicrobiales bacterium]
MKTSRAGRLPGTALAFAALLGACEPAPDTSAVPTVSGGAPSPLAERCLPDDGAITLPDGFCAVLVTDDLPGARHIAVADNGDVFVAVRNLRSGRDGPVTPGGVAVLRDTDGDGRADVTERWGVNGGNEVLLADGYVYQAPDDAVLRYPLEPGSMTPSGPPDTIVSGLPATQNHTAKSIALGGDGSLYVNIGSPSNACMEESRTPGSPGRDPCPQLDTRAGIWRFAAGRTGQRQEDGTRFATGLRNTVALGTHPGTGALYGVVHGRDQLHDMFPDRFTVAQNTEKPSEELVRITEGSDFGWPYCYHDPETGRKVLAPEYGGDGQEVGRCADKDMPIVGFPAHWAPNDLEFYTGDQFPDRYAGGAFIAFHGSWNRAPDPQEGFRVVFVPASGDELGTEWETFADGFQEMPGTARPVGVAVGPDGSLYVSESTRGRIWRIVHRGG